MVMNGSNLAKASPFFRDYGLLKIMRVTGRSSLPLPRRGLVIGAKVLSGAGISAPSLVQCMNEKDIQVFGFDGRALKAQPPIQVSGGPPGIRTAERR